VSGLWMMERKCHWEKGERVVGGGEVRGLVDGGGEVRSQVFEGGED
jgi:hypothetical protein